MNPATTAATLIDDRDWTGTGIRHAGHSAATGLRRRVISVGSPTPAAGDRRLDLRAGAWSFVDLFLPGVSRLASCGDVTMQEQSLAVPPANAAHRAPTPRISGREPPWYAHRWHQRWPCGCTEGDRRDSCSTTACMRNTTQPLRLQEWQASAQTRQCSCMSKCCAHSSGARLADHGARLQDRGGDVDVIAGVPGRRRGRLGADVGAVHVGTDALGQVTHHALGQACVRARRACLSEGMHSLMQRVSLAWSMVPRSAG